MNNELEVVATLDEFEADIERASEFIRGGFYVVGKRFAQIKDQKLWEQAETFYGTFEAYCAKRWMMSESAARKTIASAYVVDNLCIDPGQLSGSYPQSLPQNESTVRPLVSLKDPDEQREIWSEAIARAAETGNLPTASLINKIKRERKYGAPSPVVKAPEDKRIMVGSFADHAEKIPDDSIELIFTDPPYNVDHDLAPLADMASRKLKPGGSLVFYIGHLQLPQLFRVMEGQLRFWWIGAVIHQGQKALMKEYGIRVGWKPFVWFVKESRRDPSEIVTDVMDFGEREKDTHEWQQAVSEASYWIERLSTGTGLIYDPYLGGGTTIVAAKSLGRTNWIASEIDPDTAQKAAERIANAVS